MRRIPGRSLVRILEALSLAALVVLVAETALALFGSSPLPVRVPTHFNAMGSPDAWGSASMLWLLPAIASTLYLLMTWVARHPAAFNFPVRVTPFNRQRLEGIALGMIAWLKAELLSFFALIQSTIVRAARHPDRAISPVPMPLLLAVVFLTVGIHLAAIFRAGRAPS
jgi:Protein of unknown function (DUF1648)